MSNFDTNYIEKKITLILKDYETAFSSNDRHFNRISTLRTWSVMSFVLIVGADKGLNLFFDKPFITSLILAVCIFMFWFQEAEQRVCVKRNVNNVREIEAIFMDKNYGNFQSKVDIYKFRDMKIGDSHSETERKQLLRKYFFRPARFLWYGSLLLLAFITPFAISASNG